MDPCEAWQDEQDRRLKERAVELKPTPESVVSTHGAHHKTRREISVGGKAPVPLTPFEEMVLRHAIEYALVHVASLNASMMSTCGQQWNTPARTSAVLRGLRELVEKGTTSGDDPTIARWRRANASTAVKR